MPSVVCLFVFFNFLQGQFLLSSQSTKSTQVGSGLVAVLFPRESWLRSVLLTLIFHTIKCSEKVLLYSHTHEAHVLFSEQAQVLAGDCSVINISCVGVAMFDRQRRQCQALMRDI